MNADNVSTHHLHELAVLHHHGVDDAQERLVRGEETCPPCQCVALHHPLARMLRQDLDDAASVPAGGDIPLEVAARVLEHGVKLVRDELVGREDAEGGRVPIDLY